MAKRCPTCLRPEFGGRGKPDPLRHCPRALATPETTDAPYTMACLVIGLEARETALVAMQTKLQQVLQHIDDVVAAQPEEATGG